MVALECEVIVQPCIAFFGNECEVGVGILAMNQYVACDTDAGVLWFYLSVLPFALGPVELDRPAAWIVDKVVDDDACCESLEVWIAGDVVGVKIADNGDISTVIVD